jgi:hypothetical protein
MLFQGWHPGGGIVRITFQNLVAAHHAVFHFINAHQPTKLIRLVRFPFTNDLGMGFEQAQQLILHVGVSAPHRLLGLVDYLLDPRHKVFAGGNLQGGQQGLPAMADVFVSPGARFFGPQGQ